MTRYYGAYQFPNLLLNIHPDCVMYYVGYPKGPGHTTVVSEYLFRPETIADPAVFKPGARRRALGPDLEAGLGGVRARADRRGVARVHDRRVSAPGPVPVRVQRELPGEDGTREARPGSRSTDGDQADEPRRPVRAGRGEDLRVLPGRVRVPRRDGDAGGEVPPGAGLRQRPRPRALQHRRRGGAVDGGTRRPSGCTTSPGKSRPSAIFGRSRRSSRRPGRSPGATDHSTTKALYGRDPDGLEFEVCWIVPKELQTPEIEDGARADATARHRGRDRALRSPDGRRRLRLRPSRATRASLGSAGRSRRR